MVSLRGTSSTCDRPKFTCCDRCAINLLRLHLIETEDNSLDCSQVQDLLRQFKHSLEQGGVISLAIDGQVQFITQRAVQLLNQYFIAPDLSNLPESLKNWCMCQISQNLCDDTDLSPRLPFRIEQAQQQLIIRSIPSSIQNQYLFLVEEQKPQYFSVVSLELLGLTKREAEVLFWIAKDKSNSGIARVLGCCEGTVRKHLENLYKKLGVQTRIGAVMLAMERLGLLKE